MRAALSFVAPVIAPARAHICCNPDVSVTRSRP